MSLPVLVEVVRGRHVECRHRGSIAIAHADGGLLFAAGASEVPVYPRSSAKLIQALPLVESGAADAFGFSDYQLALACASHIAEERHLETARAMLDAAGFTEDALACGPAWPPAPERIARMGKAGETPGRLHNCCSGKHAGMLATARHLGLQAAGYERFDHPLQARIRDVMADVFQADMESAPCGIDGCSLPTLAVPLSRLARGFARLTGDAAIALERRAAADRLMRACMSNPHAVGGTGKFDTDVMAAFEGAVFLKFGAEAVYVIVFPALRIAAAVKIDDGAVRAAEAVAAAIISRFAVGTAAQSDFIEGYLKAPQRNAMGVEVGYVQPVSELRKALTTL